MLNGLPPGDFLLPIFETVLNGITVRGSIVGTRNDLQEAIDFAADGSVRTHVDATELLENLFGGVSAAYDFVDLAPRSYGTRPVAPLQGSFERSVDASPTVSRYRIYPPNRF